jgi:hypothetical protein
VVGTNPVVSGRIIPQDVEERESVAVTADRPTLTQRQSVAAKKAPVFRQKDAEAKPTGVPVMLILKQVHETGSLSRSKSCK